MSNYRDLFLWQKAMDLTVEIYKLTEQLPDREAYGLINQMRRAAISIPSNIAEGKGRGSDKVFGHFLSIAQGSRTELETQLEICVRVNYFKEDQIRKAMELSSEVGKMITIMLKSLRADS